MDIYEDEGVDALVDLRAAARELKKVGAIFNEGSRRAAVAEIQTAALLDIAYSLRAVAMEAVMAMPNVFESGVGETSDGGEAGGDAVVAARDFLVEGDLVTIDDGDGTVYEVFSFGMTEGAPYARIHDVSDEDEEAVTKAWLENLTRYTPVVVEPDEDPDDDFTGSAEAQSALDLLRANEAERKAKKKGTKK